MAKDGPRATMIPAPHFSCRFIFISVYDTEWHCSCYGTVLNLSSPDSRTDG